MRQLALRLSVVVLGLLVVTGCGIATSDDGKSEVETQQNDFMVSGTLTLIVENINGDVEVSGGADAGIVRVTALLSRSKHLEYRAVQDGNTVRVTIEKRRPWNWRWWRSGRSDIVVAVPQTANVAIHSYNGDIATQRVTGEIALRTSNGNIEAVGGDGAYDLRSSNGNITVVAGQGEFSLHTSNGNIRFTGNPMKGTENRLRTSNGSIKAKLSGETPSVRVDARTSNGKIAIARDATQNSWGRNQLGAIIGDGDASLSLTTSNGSITVE